MMNNNQKRKSEIRVGGGGGGVVRGWSGEKETQTELSTATV